MSAKTNEEQPQKQSQKKVIVDKPRELKPGQKILND